MSENVASMYWVRCKNLFTDKKQTIRASEFHDLHENYKCTRFDPKSEKDFDKKRIYGLQIGNYMISHYILFLDISEEAVNARAKSTRSSVPKTPTDQILRVKFSNYTLTDEKELVKNDKKEEKKAASMSRAHASTSVLNRYQKIISGKRDRERSDEVMTKAVPSAAKQSKTVELTKGKDPNSITKTLGRIRDEPKTKPASAETTKKDTKTNDISVDNRLSGSDIEVFKLADTKKSTCKVHCACYEALKKQTNLMARESEQLRIQNDELHRGNEILREAINELKHDKDTTFAEIKILSTNFQNFMSNPHPGKRSRSKPQDGIEKMSCALEKLPDHEKMPEITDKQIYCGNGITIEKGDLIGVAEAKGLQKKISLLAALFWPNEVYKWTLAPILKDQNKINNVHKEAMRNLLNEMDWDEPNQFHVSISEVGTKIKHTTSNARGEYAKAHPEYAERLKKLTSGRKEEAAKKNRYLKQFKKTIQTTETNNGEDQRAKVNANITDCNESSEDETKENYDTDNDNITGRSEDGSVKGDDESDDNEMRDDDASSETESRRSENDNQNEEVSEGEEKVVYGSKRVPDQDREEDRNDRGGSQEKENKKNSVDQENLEKCEKNTSEIKKRQVRKRPLPKQQVIKNKNDYGENK